MAISTLLYCSKNWVSLRKSRIQVSEIKFLMVEKTVKELHEAGYMNVRKESTEIKKYEHIGGRSR